MPHTTLNLFSACLALLATTLSACSLRYNLPEIGRIKADKLCGKDLIPFKLPNGVNTRGCAPQAKKHADGHERPGSWVAEEEEMRYIGKLIRLSGPSIDARIILEHQIDPKTITIADTTPRHAEIDHNTTFSGSAIAKAKKAFRSALAVNFPDLSDEDINNASLRLEASLTRIKSKHVSYTYQVYTMAPGYLNRSFKKFACAHADKDVGIITGIAVLRGSAEQDDSHTSNFDSELKSALSNAQPISSESAAAIRIGITRTRESTFRAVQEEYTKVVSVGYYPAKSACEAQI